MPLALDLQHYVTITIFYSAKVKMENFSSNRLDALLARTFCVYIWFRPGVDYSMGLDKWLVTHSTLKSSFRTLQTTCSTHWTSFPLTHKNHPYFHSLHSFIFSRMSVSHTSKHTVCSHFRKGLFPNMWSLKNSQTIALPSSGRVRHALSPGC